MMSDDLVLHLIEYLDGFGSNWFGVARDLTTRKQIAQKRPGTEEWPAGS
jgi:hypothetical protein